MTPRSRKHLLHVVQCPVHAHDDDHKLDLDTVSQVP